MDNQERWAELCAQAAVEKNKDRLIKLVAEISQLLNDKHKGVEASKGAGSDRKTG